MRRGPRAKKLSVSRSLYRKLKLLVRRYRAPYALIRRSQIILLARQGVSTHEIAQQFDCSSRNVRKWKKRFTDSPCLESLEDSPRSGRPSTIPVEIRCKLVQLACERPDTDEAPAPFRDIWTYSSLADALYEESGYLISESEVGRILRFEKIRPHRVRQWLKSSDVDFLSKAKRICNLYIRPPKDAAVICVDEKPLQVLERKYPTETNQRDGSVRFEYEYKRHGTQALLAGFDVKTGKVMGNVVPSRTGDALVAFMEKVAKRYPKGRVYIVWDNLNIHYDGKDKRWKHFNARHGKRFKFVYTPIHASWMNQIEIWFSILQRRVIKLGDFSSPKQQARRIMGYINHWNRYEKHPFRWTWRAQKRQNQKRAA